MDNKNIKIAVIGLGYVGLPLALEFAKKYDVTGFDIDESRVNELKNAVDKTLEVNIEALKESSIKYSFATEDLKQCNIYIITVPTPIDDANKPDLFPLEKASELVGKQLNQNDIVVYESTVYPGCTEEFCVPILEKFSGLKFNEDFSCGYSPERINPGDKEHTISKILKIVSGSNDECLETLNCLYSSIIEAGTFKAKSIKVAEAAKVIENAQRDINIAFVNELSLIFEKLNIDTYDVLQAARTKWNFLGFAPGLVGGHCISVDPYYLTYKSQQVGYNPEIILSGRRLNDIYAKSMAAKTVKKIVSNDINLSDARVGVFGITFKEDCPDLRNSKVFDYIKELQNFGLDVYVVDPYVEFEVIEKYLSGTKELNSDVELDCISLMVPHKLLLEDLDKFDNHKTKKKNTIFFDFKGALNRAELEERGYSVLRV